MTSHLLIIGAADLSNHIQSIEFLPLTPLSHSNNMHTRIVIMLKGINGEDRAILRALFLRSDKPALILNNYCISPQIADLGSNGFVVYDPFHYQIAIAVTFYEDYQASWMGLL